MTLEQTTLIADDMPSEQLTLIEVDAEQHVRMGYDGFLTLVEGTHAEWNNGEVTIFMPPTILHQQLLRFLATLIDSFVGLYGLGETLFAPCEVRLLSGRSSREPDLLFVANEHLDRITDKRVEGAPDLVVEIISPESVHRDRVDKFDEYEAAGVREYWVIDPRPEHRRAWFYVLNSEGRLIEQAVGDGHYHSSVLQGFWLEVDWLWQDKLPVPMRCLSEMVDAQALQTIMQEPKKAD